MNLAPKRLLTNHENPRHGKQNHHLKNLHFLLPREFTSQFTRITVASKQMGGVPCIRNLRIPVYTIIAMIADGMTEEEILEAYPDLEPANIYDLISSF